MSNLEPRIEAVRQKYDLERSDFWQIKQNGQWVCKHAALEIVAVKAGIEWMAPQIIEADAPNLVTSMIVTGKMGNRTEWATGETNATNYTIKGKQPAYPWAMSEKRAKDRVVLKLVGIHGLVYSEDEAEGFKEEQAPPIQKPSEPIKNAPPVKHKNYDVLLKELRLCTMPEDINRAWKDEQFVTLRKVMPEYWQAILKEEAGKIAADLKAKAEAKDTVEAVKDMFPGSDVKDERITHPLMAGE